MENHSMEAKYNDKPVNPGLEKFVAEFCDDRCNELDVMRQAFAQKNFTQISELAHKWKGFCEPYGFSSLGNYAIDIEKNCKLQSLSDLQALLNEVENYLKYKKQNT
jgi:HPt (histidine-containing phosphotransfer) domain-containing protein